MGEIIGNKENEQKAPEQLSDPEHEELEEKNKSKSRDVHEQAE